MTTKYWCPKCDITVKGAARIVCIKCQGVTSQCDDVGDEYAIKRLLAENERLREACTLALGIMEQKNRVAVLKTAKFVDVKFAPEDIAVLRAALKENT